jgi:hypothetical protein
MGGKTKSNSEDHASHTRNPNSTLNPEIRSNCEHIEIKESDKADICRIRLQAGTAKELIARWQKLLD